MQYEGAHEATQVDKVDAFISCELSAFLESYLSDDQTIEDHLYYETKYRILIDCGAKKSDWIGTQYHFKLIFTKNGVKVTGVLFAVENFLSFIGRLTF